MCQCCYMCFVCGFVHWGSVKCRTVNVIIFMCFQLFSGLCISGCAWYVFFFLEMGLVFCGVCLESVHVLIFCVGYLVFLCGLMWRRVEYVVHGCKASFLGACWVVCGELSLMWCGVWDGYFPLCPVGWVFACTV